MSVPSSASSSSEQCNGLGLVFCLSTPPPYCVKSCWSRALLSDTTHPSTVGRYSLGGGLGFVWSGVEAVTPSVELCSKPPLHVRDSLRVLTLTTPNTEVKSSLTVRQRCHRSGRTPPVPTHFPGVHTDPSSLSRTSPRLWDEERHLFFACRALSGFTSAGGTWMCRHPSRGPFTGRVGVRRRPSGNKHLKVFLPTVHV